MRKLVTIAGGIVLALVVAGTAEGGILADDTTGMPGWRDTLTFDTANVPPNISFYTADIDYNVYEPGACVGSPVFGFDPHPGHYVYAYQIVAVMPGLESDPDVNQLSVAPGGYEVFSMGYHAPDPNMVIPDAWNSSLTTAFWHFDPPVYPGSASAVMYFTAPAGPEWDGGSTMGNPMGAKPDPGLALPRPIPEPGTLVLLALGLVALRRPRRRA